MKSNSLSLFLLLFLFFGLFSFAQNNQEREHRIKKSQFPSEALQTITENNKDFQRLKFYKAVDSTTNTFTAKFKKARLNYEMEFNDKGKLNGISFAIKPVDIPEESFGRITAYLTQEFEKSKVRKMLQNYPVRSNDNIEKPLKNAFQNLILPNIRYELFVKGKKDGTRADYEITFDAEGNLVNIRKALPANFDRVLY